MNSLNYLLERQNDVQLNLAEFLSVNYLNVAFD